MGRIGCGPRTAPGVRAPASFRPGPPVRSHRSPHRHHLARFESPVSGDSTSVPGRDCHFRYALARPCRRLAADRSRPTLGREAVGGGARYCRLWRVNEWGRDPGRNRRTPHGAARARRDRRGARRCGPRPARRDGAGPVAGSGPRHRHLRDWRWRGLHIQRVDGGRPRRRCGGDHGRQARKPLVHLAVRLGGRARGTRHRHCLGCRPRDPAHGARPDGVPLCARVSPGDAFSSRRSAKT